MKISLFLGVMLAVAGGARAQNIPATVPAVVPSQSQPTQQQSSTTDAWGTEPKPAAASITDGSLVPATSTVLPPDSTYQGTALDATAPAPSNGLGAVKPLNPQPKLNPNSTGTYDKKAVKKQIKHSDRVVTKRRRTTYRYADYHRGDQIRGIRRMEKGKIATGSTAR